MKFTLAQLPDNNDQVDFIDSDILLAKDVKRLIDKVNNIDVDSLIKKIDEQNKKIDEALSKMQSGISVEMVDTLPTDIKDVKQNTLYFVKSSDSDYENRYAEYVYTGSLSEPIDSNKWEKLGDVIKDVTTEDINKIW